uniref:Glycosyltransferase n=1 Tax=viral metagenome TaxID=1070528 RepID=A0A6C0AZJ0_9ZZZZ
MLNTITDIKNILYINLENRLDRKTHVEGELRKVGLNIFQRFNAIKLKNGALGCSLSHLKCLEIAKINEWTHVFICEDDISFLEPDIFIKQMNGFLKEVKEWDVILVAGNNINNYTIINDYSVKVTECQTTTGYIVKKEYYDVLIANYKSGIENLIKLPHKHYLYAIDQFWKKLQEKDNWFLITPLTVVQKEGYSDIEQRVTNYAKPMTELDKPYFLKKLTKFK